MEATRRKRMVGVVIMAAGLLTLGSASAWYGDPWYRPYGSGAMVYERQNMMRGHGYNMSELAEMIDGRRLLNRAEAVRLARELEDGFGDELIRNYAPGTVVAGSRTAPWAWRDFGAFRGYAEAARQASGRLAEALEKQHSAEGAAQAGVAGPSPRRGHGPWGRRWSEPVSVDVIREFGALNATCGSCHMHFRGPRR